MATAEALEDIRRRVRAACDAAGRAHDEVGLIAVSKTFPVQAVREAWAHRQRDFGESRPQELRDKARELPDARWHFIGRLQTNKAKYVAPIAWRVHALEDVRGRGPAAHRAVHGHEPRLRGGDPPRRHLGARGDGDLRGAGLKRPNRGRGQVTLARPGP